MIAVIDNLAQGFRLGTHYSLIMQRQLGSSERTHYCSSIRDHLLVGQASVIETSGDQTAGFEMAGSSLLQQLGGRNVVEVFP
jgi:hypothetical protein